MDVPTVGSGAPVELVRAEVDTQATDELSVVVDLYAAGSTSFDAYVFINPGDPDGIVQRLLAGGLLTDEIQAALVKFL
ncbi:hypothetical protein [Deinococcus kurensis]|uniref:hypothetical protein n=1 Tax=Deinococcus kurensis TaxID=2662757 RepID=UPI0012D2A66B|nr:hypothetical protein [Deinococcus kurensis]